MDASDSALNLLDGIAADFVARYRRGERPTIAEYAAKHPEHASLISEILPTLVAMEDLKPDLEAPVEPVRQASPVLRQLGDFRILREIGRGGMGVVYEAVQESLGRKVALKVLSHSGSSAAGRQARFEREAKAAAKLHHSNIVPVFGVGSSDGVHYYAMQFIRGLGLDVVLEQLKAQRTAAARPRSSAVKEPAATEKASEPAPQRRNELAATLALSMVSGVRGVGSGSDTDPTHTNLTAPFHAAATEQAQRSELVQMPVSDVSVGRSHAASRVDSSGSYYASVARIGVQVAEALHYAHGQPARGDGRLGQRRTNL